jgi:lipopolysaccharide export system permease protein
MSTARETGRRPGRTLYAYLIREMMFPAAFTLGGLTLLVLTESLLKLSDLLINRGLGGGVVAAIAFYEAVPLAAEMLPFAVLVGTLVALGRLSADNEIVALEACGVSARRLHGPVFASAAALTVVGIGLAAFAAPWADRALDTTLADISREHPGATMRAGVLHRFGEWRLQAREVSGTGDRMRGVVLWTPEIGETVFAERGALDPDPTGPTRITMENAMLVLTSGEDLHSLRFDTMSTLLPESESIVPAKHRSALAAATFRELNTTGWGTDANGEDARAARVEMHRRFARPLATLFFGLLVMPIFLSRGASSRASGGLMGLVATVLYYGLVQAANGLLKGGGNVALAIWLPDAILAVVGSLLFLWLGRASVFAWRMERGRRPARRWLRFGRIEERRADALRKTTAEREQQREQDHRMPRIERRRIRTHRWALQRYVAGRFLAMLGLSFGVLLVGYLVIDVLERLQWFARFNATAYEAVRFYGFRIPVLVSRLVPMALLVATALTVSLVAVQGELAGMRACGVAAPRGMLPVLVICAIVVPFSFLWNNEVVPRANTLNEYLKATEIKADEVWGQVSPADGRRPPAVWFLEGHRLLEAKRLDPQLGTVLGLTVYELASNGLPVSREDALGGRHLGGGMWRLFEPRRVEIGEDGPRRVRGARIARLWEGVPVEVDTKNLSVGELREEIGYVEEDGLDATVFRVDLYSKIAVPLGCLVLPAVAFFFAVSGPPYPTTAASLVVSVLVAVSSVLLSGISSSLGYRKLLPPLVAGMTPTVVFSLFALYFGLRLRGMFTRA